MSQGFVNSQITSGVTPVPTQQIFNSGSGTYTTPAGVAYIIVEMIGGGGGGAGSGTSPGAAGNGSNTTFGTLTAGFGNAGTTFGGIAASTSSVNGDLNISGGSGGPGGVGVQQFGGTGGGGFFGGGGPQGISGASPGGNALVIGGGGGGGGSVGTANAGGGGAAGSYLVKLITSPSATYAYAVGDGGTAGTAGTGGVAGGAGLHGIIIVTEYYSAFTPASATGTGNYVLQQSPTINQANLVGVTTNSNAAAGSVGEYIESIIAAPGISVTSGTAISLTSISLSAGDWDVWGTILMNPAGTTTTSYFDASISLVNNTPAVPWISGGTENIAAGGARYNSISPRRISIASTAPVFLVTGMTFAVSTMQAYGFIAARRVR